MYRVSQGDDVWHVISQNNSATSDAARAFNSKAQYGGDSLALCQAVQENIPEAVLVNCKPFISVDELVKRTISSNYLCKDSENMFVNDRGSDQMFR